MPTVRELKIINSLVFDQDLRLLCETVVCAKLRIQRGSVYSNYSKWMVHSNRRHMAMKAQCAGTPNLQLQTEPYNPPGDSLTDCFQAKGSSMVNSFQFVNCYVYPDWGACLDVHRLVLTWADPDLLLSLHGRYHLTPYTSMLSLCSSSHAPSFLPCFKIMFVCLFVCVVCLFVLFGWFFVFVISLHNPVFARLFWIFPERDDLHDHPIFQYSRPLAIVSGRHTTRAESTRALALPMELRSAWLCFYPRVPRLHRQVWVAAYSTPTLSGGHERWLERAHQGYWSSPHTFCQNPRNSSSPSPSRRQGQVSQNSVDWSFYSPWCPWSAQYSPPNKWQVFASYRCFWDDWYFIHLRCTCVNPLVSWSQSTHLQPASTLDRAAASTERSSSRLDSGVTKIRSHSNKCDLTRVNGSWWVTYERRVMQWWNDAMVKWWNDEMMKYCNCWMINH